MKLQVLYSLYNEDCHTVKIVFGRINIKTQALYLSKFLGLTLVNCYCKGSLTFITLNSNITEISQL